MRRLGFLFFSAVVVAALYALNRYVARRVGSSFGVTPRGKVLLGRLLLFGLLGSVAIRIGGFLWPFAQLGGPSLLSSSFEFGIVLGASFLLIQQLPRRAVKGVVHGVNLIQKALGRVDPSPAQPQAAKLIAAELEAELEAEPKPSHTQQAEAQALGRRQFLNQAGVASALCLGQASAFYGSLRGRIDYQLLEQPFSIPGLPRALDGYRIVQLSDIHIGQFVGETELDTAVSLIRQSRPDLIVLTGDLLDQQLSLAPLLGRFVRKLSGIARDGVVTISGNHDFYAGVDAIEATLKQAGVAMLRNRGLRIGDRSAGFALLGVDDVWGRRLGLGPDLSRALESLRQSEPGAAGTRLVEELPRILLCHNPIYFRDTSGSVALQLSGHTHGGQLIPADRLMPDSWIAGRYERNGSHLYVNRGFGTVGAPARLFAPPEVTSIILTT